MNLVFVTNWMTNADAMWEEPTMAAYFERLASFARVVCYGEAALLGDTEGGPMAMIDYPIGMPEETTEKLVDRYEQNWGVTSEILGLTAPTMAHDVGLPPRHQRAKLFTRTSADTRSGCDAAKSCESICGRVAGARSTTPATASSRPSTAPREP